MILEEADLKRRAEREAAALAKKEAATRARTIESLVKASKTQTEIIQDEFSNRLAIIESFTQKEIEMYGEKEALKAALTEQTNIKLAALQEKQTRSVEKSLSMQIGMYGSLGTELIGIGQAVAGNKLKELEAD